MKKNVLALSIATMVGGLGFAGAASAALAVAESGSGHILTIPYYTAQNGNMTVLHVTNTDDKNGKAVKVRFRGASNSDDVLDFQVFMSPGDVWTAAVSKGADGKAQLVTADKTCTLPAFTAQPDGTKATSFVPDRLTKKGWTDADKAEQTLEGYVEILNMADIASFGTDDYNLDQSPKSLFGAIKHKSGVAPCTSTILNGSLKWEKVAAATGPAAAVTAKKWLVGETTAGASVTDDAAGVTAGWKDVGLRAPSGTLNAQWYIQNVAQTTTYSGSANVIVADGATRAVFSPQKNGDAILTTADPLMTGNTGTAAATALIPPQFYDVPDLSTPYETTTTTAVLQAAALTNAIKRTSVSNQYATAVGVSAKTDWVFSMPTRRYTIAANYGTKAKVDEYNDTASVGSPAASKAVANDGYRVHSAVTGNAFTGGTNTSVNAGGQICLDALDATFWDREEQSRSDGAVFSPGTPDKFKLCGEVSVTSFTNDASAVGPKLTRQVVKAPYINGWGVVNLGVGSGVPMLGTAFIKLTNANATPGVSGTYGITWPHTYTK